MTDFFLDNRPENKKFQWLRTEEEQWKFVEPWPRKKQWVVDSSLLRQLEPIETGFSQSQMIFGISVPKIDTNSVLNVQNRFLKFFGRGLKQWAHLEAASLQKLLYTHKIKNQFIEN